VISSCNITNDPSTWPAGDRIWDVCRAIAIAEGANIAGSAPDRYNNPGDLSKGDEHRQAFTGYTILPDGELLIQFATKMAGWTALYSKISRIVQGQSSVYSTSMTWTQFAEKYAGSSLAWAANVTRQLGVQIGDTVGGYFA
jgi:hypothetical protein